IALSARKSVRPSGRADFFNNEGFEQRGERGKAEAKRSGGAFAESQRAERGDKNPLLSARKSVRPSGRADFFNNEGFEQRGERGDTLIKKTPYLH
ncbi:MAG: hypothetical protein IJK60_03080, partial [Clostridia bacterium]|nr:hypothetical protein [Clostridia bacterium]